MSKDTVCSLGQQIEGAPLPEVLDSYIGFMRVRIMEDLIWMHGSGLYVVMAEGGGGSYAPGDKGLLEVGLKQLACMPPRQAPMNPWISRMQGGMLWACFLSCNLACRTQGGAAGDGARAGGSQAAV